MSPIFLQGRTRSQYARLFVRTSTVHDSADSRSAMETRPMSSDQGASRGCKHRKGILIPLMFLPVLQNHTYFQSQKVLCWPHRF